MPNLLILGRGGVIDIDHVVAIAPAKSAPVKRLLEAAGTERVLNMTYGYPRQSVILLDNGFLVIASRSVGELARAIGVEVQHEDGKPPPWWT